MITLRDKIEERELEMDVAAALAKRMIAAPVRDRSDADLAKLLILLDTSKGHNTKRSVIREVINERLVEIEEQESE